MFVVFEDICTDNGFYFAAFFITIPSVSAVLVGWLLYSRTCLH